MNILDSCLTRQFAVMDGEFELPEHIIHRIQSFLTGKEAARTTLLSMSWHHAAITRPNLDFDYWDFRKSHDVNYRNTFDEFSTFVNNSICRYEKRKLKIQSFRLRTSYLITGYDDFLFFFKQVIPKALSMDTSLLDIGGYFAVPNVVFEAENLVGLSVESCKIDLKPDQPVTRPRLESLSLINLQTNSGSISNIISGCPSIKKLSFKWIMNLDGGHLDGVNIIYSHTLTHLVLCAVKICILLNSDLSSKLPSLKELTLRNIMLEDQNDIRISSLSLERLNFVCFCSYSNQKIEFDVPILRKFMFEGSPGLHLSFASNSRDWASSVTITNDSGLTTTWFRTLQSFLIGLGRSEIHLCLNIGSKTELEYEAFDFQGVRKPEVDSLTIDMDGLWSITCYILFDGLFRICRPKIIAHYILPESSCGGNTNNDFLAKRLLEGMNGKCSIGSQFMSSVHDLKEVNVQLFDDDVAEWTCLPWESVLDTLTSIKRKRKIRFQLDWKP